MKKCVIMTYSGIHYIVEEEKALNISSLAPDGEVMLDGNLVKYKNISDIISLDKYIESFPDKRPQYFDRYKNIESYGFDGTIKHAKGDALKGMIKGLKNYISGDQYQGTNAPLELLEKMENKLKKELSLESYI